MSEDSDLKPFKGFSVVKEKERNIDHVEITFFN